MKRLFSFFFFLYILAFFSSITYAEPVLFFSDITSGPKTGLGDGLGQGAIVSIWGTGLGSSQGNSKVYIGGQEAAYVYYWGNADGSSLAGPAKLYESHKMQTISFSIPSSAPDGATNIYVVVNGKKSNTLPFTIRPGNIYFVKVTGNDNTGDGSWSNPWRTLDYVGSGAGGRIIAGDIIYVGSGVEETDGFRVGTSCSSEISGTLTHPISVIAYPGAVGLAQGTSFGIGNYCQINKYWNFAKLIVKTNGMGIGTFYGGRIIGNEVTNYPGGCADGQAGAIGPGQGSMNGGLKIFGNYIHDFGCDSTSNKHHTFYISNRTGTPLESYELGWNYLKDSKARGGLHVYDEGICGDFIGTMRIHDNVVVNQAGVGVAIVGRGTVPVCFTMDVEIFNNLFINTGLPKWGDPAIDVQGSLNKSNIRIYNNSVYNYSGVCAVRVDFAGTWEYKNNIVVDTNNLPFSCNNVKPLPAASNNIWYNGGDGNPASPPSWDTNSITSDPLFVNPGSNDFRLKEGSPAIDAGYNATNVLTRDIIGVPRPQGDVFDIGAYEFDKGTVPDYPPSAPKNLRLVE